MSAVFIDTSFVVALNTSQDQWHAAAQSCWQDVLSRKASIVTTTFVFDEVVTALNARNLHRLAVTVGRQILESPAFKLFHVDDQLLSRGWDYFVRHDDKRYSLTDCISFVLMEQRGIRQALTFDRHFAQAGFEILPVQT
jgi:predicted nucleic acid-binding protein